MAREFKVVLDGFDLSPELETRIREAIQKVVMHEIAELDFGGDRAAAVLKLENGGGTQGIVCAVLDERISKETFSGFGPDR
jgi:hypothetical protein